MANLFIKICGVTRVEQALDLAALDIQAIGLIGVPQTPRYLSPDRMETLVAALPSGVETVGVFRDRPLSDLVEIVQRVGLTTLQLHGQETPATCEALRHRCPSLRLVKAIRLKSAQDLDRIGSYTGVVDRVLIDTYHPQQLGGTGQTWNWSWLQGYPYDLPWILAGGLTPDNIRAALTTVQPFGVDVSSGVERAPGDKDLHTVRQLVERIRSLEGVAIEG